MFALLQKWNYEIVESYLHLPNQIEGGSQAGNR